MRAAASRSIKAPPKPPTRLRRGQRVELWDTHARQWRPAHVDRGTYLISTATGGAWGIGVSVDGAGQGGRYWKPLDADGYPPPSVRRPQADDTPPADPPTQLPPTVKGGTV